MTNLRFISAETVRAKLTQKICIQLVRDAMLALSAGKTRQALRQIIDLGGGNAFGTMPGAVDGLCHGAKLISIFPDNVARGGKAHEGVIMLFDPEDGTATCAVDAGEVTAIRTAAASAVATDALARDDAAVLAILGTGEQAWQHALAIWEVRAIKEIRLWGRNAAKSEALAARIRNAIALPVEVCADVTATCAGADIICTTTAAETPILSLEHVAPGTHINAIGSSRAGPTEIAPQLIPASLFIPDHREGVIAQGSEFIDALKLGIADEDAVGPEIGEILAAPAKGRSSADQITIYKSLGSVAQDLAAAHWLANIAE
jgi:ornithine cyclodeaminase/alanine dehydrogenase-like protein (mu-crystallin family)